MEYIPYPVHSLLGPGQTVVERSNKGQLSAFLVHGCGSAQLFLQIMVVLSAIDLADSLQCLGHSVE